MVLNEHILKTLTKKDKNLYVKVCDFYQLVLEGREIASKLKRYKSEVATEGGKVCCHSIALAVSMYVPDIKVVHGAYVGFTSTRKGKKNGDTRRFLKPTTCRHSWNVTPRGIIIDSYPVGMLAFAPMVVASKGMYAPFGSKLYWEDEKVLKEIDMKHHRRQARQLISLAKLALRNREKGKE